MKLQADLREFVRLLNAHSVDYVVIGGHAVAFHGYVRYTGDIDILVRASKGNGEAIVRVLEEFGFGQLELVSETFTEPDMVIQLGRPPNRIDILTSAAALDFDEVWEARVLSEIDGLPTSYLGRAQLLRNKRAAGRPKDLADVEALEAAGKVERDRR